MSSLIIVPPTAIVQSSLPRLFTPDPKEAVSVTGGDIGVAVDFGQAVTLDSVYVGYHNAKGAQSTSLVTTTGYGSGDVATVTGSYALAPLGLGFPYHSFRRFPATTSRYWTQYFSRASGDAFYIGVLAFGMAFQPSLGHEYGSGRFVTDTGSVERLKSGGFGVDEGVTAGGWQWTMGDLTDLEIRQLYQLAKLRGSSRSLLVVEDPDQTDGLNERIHWGILDKLDPYERFAPGANRWAMKINDWA